MGVLLCLLSAAGFGAMAIFGKLAFGAGIGVVTLCVLRFAIAGGVLVPLAAARRVTLPRGRLLATAVGLGAVGYATQAGLFFLALERVDPSLLALLLYTYPAMVCVVAIALRREPATARRFGALALACAGLLLVLGVAAGGELDPLGVVMALGSAATYTTYILVSDRVVDAVDPLGLSAVVSVSASATFLVIGLASGAIDLGFAGDGWLWMACIGVVSTVLPIVTFFAGMRRVGPSTASILSTFEPPVTVALAFLVFGETLAAAQLIGAALVLGAVVVLQAPERQTAVAAAA